MSLRISLTVLILELALIALTLVSVRANIEISCRVKVSKMDDALSGAPQFSQNLALSLLLSAPQLWHGGRLNLIPPST
jgi:hypothetical protein